MSNRYVEVDRTPTELRIPRGMSARVVLEAILAHMGYRVEVVTVYHPFACYNKATLVKVDEKEDADG